MDFRPIHQSKRRFASFYLLLLIDTCSFPQSLASRCLRWAWLRWLGMIAYGMYLFHEVVLIHFESLWCGSAINFRGSAMARVDFGGCPDLAPRESFLDIR